MPLQRHSEYQPLSKPEKMLGNIMLACELPHSLEQTSRLDILSVLFHAYSKVPAIDLILKRTFASFALQKFRSLALFPRFLISEISSIIVV